MGLLGLPAGVYKKFAREIVALVGRNGAGKTTLLRTLDGLYRRLPGRIEFEDRNIAGMPAPDIDVSAWAMYRKAGNCSQA